MPATIYNNQPPEHYETVTKKQAPLIIPARPDTSYLTQIEEWHQIKKIEFQQVERPYSQGEDLQHLVLHMKADIEDDGHRFVRMFMQDTQGNIQFQGYLCLCGIYVDVHSESYYRVKRCMVDSHYGCQVLLPDGIEKPYLLKSTFRDYLKPASRVYYSQDNNYEYYKEWLEHTAIVEARKELQALTQ